MIQKDIFKTYYSYGYLDPILFEATGTAFQVPRWRIFAAVKGIAHKVKRYRNVLDVGNISRNLNLLKIATALAITNFSDAAISTVLQDTPLPRPRVGCEMNRLNGTN